MNHNFLTRWVISMNHIHLKPFQIFWFSAPRILSFSSLRNSIWGTSQKMTNFFKMTTRRRSRALCGHFWPFWHAHWPSANTEFKSGQIKIGAATYCWTWNVHDRFSLKSFWLVKLSWPMRAKFNMKVSLRICITYNTLGITVLSIPLLIKWHHRFDKS